MTMMFHLISKHEIDSGDERCKGESSKMLKLSSRPGLSTFEEFWEPRGAVFTQIAKVSKTYDFSHPNDKKHTSNQSIS